MRLCHVTGRRGAKRRTRRRPPPGASPAAPCLSLPAFASLFPFYPVLSYPPLPFIFLFSSSTYLLPGPVRDFVVCVAGFIVAAVFKCLPRDFVAERSFLSRPSADYRSPPRDPRPVSSSSVTVPRGILPLFRILLDSQIGLKFLQDR